MKGLGRGKRSAKRGGLRQGVVGVLGFVFLRGPPGRGGWSGRGLCRTDPEAGDPTVARTPVISPQALCGHPPSRWTHLYRRRNKIGGQNKPRSGTQGNAMGPSAGGLKGPGLHEGKNHQRTGPTARGGDRENPPPMCPQFRGRF